MNKLFKNPSYKANIGYNGFNMEQRLKFTSTTGELLPVYFDLLQPGDKVKASEELKTRTLPLTSPAMCSIQENFDWFFVPMEQIYKLFGSWFFRIDDHSSSIFDMSAIYDSIPSISAANLVTVAQNMQTRWSYFSAAHGANFRLAEMLGIPMLKIANERQSMNSIQPMFACAYQKIYFDYYRLPDRELVDPSAFSLDVFYNTGQISATAAERMFTLRYAPWKRDFFTSLYISPIFGQGSLSGIEQNANQSIKDVSKLFSQWLSGGTSVITTANPVGEETNGSPGASNGVPTQLVQESAYIASSASLRLDYLSQALSPTSIRSSFALQKLLEVTRRAGKHYDAQQLAHFGVKLPHGIAGEVTYLGSHTSRITIGDVVSTAETSEGVLGQQAGKGYGYNRSGDITFTAPSHGILMCIYHADPEVDYSDEGLDRLHTLINPADWRRPEFDNLGMQPLFAYQGEIDVTDASTNSIVLGWQYRYSELKTKYNRVVGGLKFGRNLAFWTTQRTFNSNNLNSFLVSPTFLNSVMEVGYSPTVADPFNSDPLIHEVMFNVRKASKMSEYGLESL